MPDLIRDIMGKSPKSLRVCKEIRRVSRLDGAVLISGERGCRKDLVARVIHDNSARSKGPFILVDLAAVPRDSAEGELFGADGTVEPRDLAKGRIGEAEGGTLVLDDVAETDFVLQERLCKFLRGGVAVSSDRDQAAASVRVVCSTNRNLKEVVEKGEFKKDLYDLLSSVHIKIPPLRDRKEDILALAQGFLEKAAARFDTGQKELSKEAGEFLVKYNWPGDVRELEDMMKRAALLSSGRVLDRKSLVLGDVNCCSIKEFLEEKLKRYLKEMTRLENCNLYGNVLSEVERSLITIVLKETSGNQLKAAKTLGINRNTLRSKIKEYKIRL